jgi:CHAT domain-containing protein/tetratricopeptide (TPR) repeat protein
MTKGPGPGNLIRLSNVQTTSHSNHSGEKRSWHSHRTLLPVIVAILVLATSSVFAQSAPSATGRKLPHQELVRPGVVVEKVEKGSGGEKAGIQKGDVIVSWSGCNEHRSINNPFDLDWVRVEQQPRGALILEGFRNRSTKSWAIGQELLGLTVDPITTGRLNEGISRARGFEKKGQWQSAKQQWQRSMHGIELAQNGWLHPWLWLRIAETLEHSKKWKDADEAYKRALQLSSNQRPMITTRIYRAWTDSFEERGDLVGAIKPAELALRWTQSWSLNTLTEADVLNSTANYLWRTGNITRSEELGLRDLALKEHLAPNSLVLANALFMTGNIYIQKGELTKATEYLTRASSITEKLAMRNHVAAAIMHSLGEISWRLGDFEKADTQFRKALSIWSECQPRSINFALSVYMLGAVALSRGRLEEAEQQFWRSLRIQRQVDFYGQYIAASFSGLADVSRIRGDFSAARKYIQASLKILHAKAPGFIDEAAYLLDLGQISAEQGFPDEAKRLFLRALDIQRRTTTSNLDIAAILNQMAKLGIKSGSFDEAERDLNEASKIENAISLRCSQTAETFKYLGQLAYFKHDLIQAKQYYERQLAVLHELAPASAERADALGGLANIYTEEDRTDLASHYYELSITAMENQMGTLGGTVEIRTDFRSHHEKLYRDYINFLLSCERPQPALDVLEQSRARSMLETLNSARIDIRMGADGRLIDLESSLQATIRAKSQRRIELLSADHSDAQLKEIDSQISDLTSEYQEVESQIRASSPAYAALTQPQPLTAKEIQTQLLDQNTLLLEYSLGDDRSHVFAVTPDSLEAFELPRRADIEKQARLVYQLLTARNHPVKGESEGQRDKRWAESAKAFDRASAELSRMVLAPVAAQMKDKRLVIVADGALNYVPFAALPEPEALARLPQPLAVNHEIVSLPSASVLGLLRQQYKDRKPAPNAVAVLADPVFEKNDPRVFGPLPKSAAGTLTRGSEFKRERGEKQVAAKAGRKKPAARKATSGDDIDALLSVPVSASLLTRSAGDLGFSREGQIALPRLRYTRKEADAIYAVTPAAKGLEATDFRANRATAISPDLAGYRIVHFATHGLLNSQHPELSGLVFSLVDKNGNAQDGFLTLQDIYNLNLPADLVVLSACETGLGKEISGEGLIGLTRGFMYAGASRVVASLWNVSDVATAHLMAEFYRSMEKDGLPPAAALRAAQVKMLQQKRWASPYYWAAFQLQGEWK